jgi:type IV pilus assembly protein PilC
LKNLLILHTVTNLDNGRWKKMRYTYIAKTLSGNLLRGTHESDSIEELAFHLRQKEIFLIKCKNVNTINIISMKPNLKTISIFCKQFSISIKAGIPLCEVLNLLYDQMIHKSIKKSLASIKDCVQKGKSLHESMKEFTDVYPKFMLNMIYLGEESGKLDIILKELSEYYQKEYKLLKKFTNSMIYPSVVFGTLMVVSFFLLIKVIPVFIINLNSYGGETPLITKLVLGISSFLCNNIIWILIFQLVLVFITIGFSKTEKGRMSFDKAMFKCPVFGPVYKKFMYTRFSKSMNILLDSGIGLVNAFEIVYEVIDNTYFKLQLRRGMEDIKKGNSLAGSISIMNIFPQFFIAMIKIGEETGRLDEMFLMASDIFYEEAEGNVEKATALLEPILIIFLGALIGIIILSVMLPMLNVMEAIQ